MGKTYDRRDFIRVSALSTGGMLIAFNFLKSCKPGVQPPANLEDLDYKDFNAYIKIAENGAVTIFSPNPEIGQGVKTSMPMIVAEELGVSWDMVHVVQADLDTESYTRQVAGGSNSIRRSWSTLRETGATAKKMLITAGAAKLVTSPENCTLENGIISDGENEIGIGEVVNDAALLEVPANVELKDPKAFTIIGSGRKNVDNHKIVTGAPIFGMDYRQEGMLYASMQRPPFGYTLDSYDDTSAREVPGVIDVFVFLDELIAVVAKDTFTAMKANKLIRPKWKLKNKPANSREENEKMLQQLEGEKYKEVVSSGDVDKAFSEAEVVVERVYETPYLPHAPLEPMNFFAHVTDEFVKLAGPIQTPERTAEQVAKMLERDVKDVSLEMTRIGGGFGRRLRGNFVLEVAAISHQLKKPVQLVYSREDDMLGGLYRPALNYKVIASIKDNQFTGYRIRQAGQGRYSRGASKRFPLSAVDHYRVEDTSIKSDITTMAWRAPQSNSIAFAEQCLIDEVAEKLEVDTVSLHLQLLEKAKTKARGQHSYDPERMAGVIKLVAEKGNWGNSPENIYQGFATYFSHNTYAAEIAEVEMDNGKPVVKTVHCAIDCGILVNPLGAEQQIAGGIIDGIGHSMYGEFVIEDGRPVQTNYDQYRQIRMMETPHVKAYFVESDEDPTGLGEPSLPPAGPALANAIYAATGKRLTKQPFIKNLNT